MKHLLILTLIGFLIAGCSPAIISQNNAPSGNPNIASRANEGTDAEATAAAQMETLPSSIIVTANPTAIPLSPIQGNTVVPVSSPTSISTQGWKTFASAVFGIAMDYPSDWSVTENTDGVTFASSQGMTVLLKISPFNGTASGLINQRCLPQTNSHKVDAEICVETGSFFSYSASFKIMAINGKNHELILSTSSREAAPFFEAMFESVRPAE